MSDRRFESTVTGPEGISVQVTITVPVEASWKGVEECSELAAMGATTTAGHVHESKWRCPF